MTFDTEVEAGEDIDAFEGVTEIELARSSARQLYNMGAYVTHPERWERVRSEILFEDLIADFEGHRASVISCPFHGRDSTPSFHLYKGTNDAWCFGCPEGQKYYDSVRFVAAKMGFTRVQALKWLEKHYNLPPIADIRMEDEEDPEDQTVTLGFQDLAGPYIALASRDIWTTKDAELAQDYIRIFFEAEKLEDPLPLARVLGPEMVRSILAVK